MRSHTSTRMWLVLASCLLLISGTTLANNEPTTNENGGSHEEQIWECSSEEQSVTDNLKSDVCKSSGISSTKDNGESGLPEYLQNIIVETIRMMVGGVLQIFGEIIQGTVDFYRNEYMLFRSDSTPFCVRVSILVAFFIIPFFVLFSLLFILLSDLEGRRARKIERTPICKHDNSRDTDPHEKVPVPADIILLNKLIQREVKIMKDTVVEREDSKSPLCSISSFREVLLKPEVRLALDDLNFRFPTRIQETVLPLLMMEPPSNLIARVEYGAEKTAAFVLTMLCRIDVNVKSPQCICLAPTLKSVEQIGKVVENTGRYMENLKIHYAIEEGNNALAQKLTDQIVIGTPEIIRDYLQEYKCIDPRQIRCMVIDEADTMHHQGLTDISTNIYNIVEEASDSVQFMVFSATFDEPVINFATNVSNNAITALLKREEQALPNIKQFYVKCASRDSKYAAIVNLCRRFNVSSVIFCHTKAIVMWLYENMKALGRKVDVLHGDMNVIDRADTIIRFKRGDLKMLITTNVFARGIDVAQVSVVINYNLPIKYDEQDMPLVIDGFTQPDCETYCHRIGTTGRFGKNITAINLVDSEDSMNMINVLENRYKIKIARIESSEIDNWKP